uniref:Uncharacterized protein n=1 Tax=viral metagenome TaxID=1070528 RepID=A0A6C0JLB8_9ZZZZ
MYYSDNKYKASKKYKQDGFKLTSDIYHIQPGIKNEKFLLTSEKHIANKNLKDILFVYNAPVYNMPVYNAPIKYKNDKDTYTTLQYGDMEFYNWLKKQSDPSIAILAEIVHSPKLNVTLEQVRQNINDIDTISIEEYRKIKRLGSRQVKWLKELKTKYGIHILKFLQYSLL